MHFVQEELLCQNFGKTRCIYNQTVQITDEIKRNIWKYPIKSDVADDAWYNYVYNTSCSSAFIKHIYPLCLNTLCHKKSYLYIIIFSQYLSSCIFQSPWGNFCGRLWMMKYIFAVIRGLLGNYWDILFKSFSHDCFGIQISRCITLTKQLIENYQFFMWITK